MRGENPVMKNTIAGSDTEALDSLLEKVYCDREHDFR